MTPTKGDLYLIPHDFTEVAESAVNYALNLCVNDDDRIVLIHIVKKESQKKDAEIKLKAVTSDYPAEVSAKMASKVIVGSLFEDINRAAELTNATTIIMGTHGASGMQKVFGSYALKVVGSSKIPFVITQSKTKANDIERIAMPFSYARETVQIARFATALAKKYNASIDLIGFRDKDKSLQQNMATNQLVLRRSLTDNGVDHQIISLPGKEEFSHELLTYVREGDIDIVAAAYFEDALIPVFSSGSFVQYLITNDLNIPVLTINAQALVKMGSFMAT